MANKNFYFNEETFQKKILEYQKTCKLNEDNIIIEKNEKIEYEITKDIEKIIAAIINRYNYWIWETVEDMKQHAALECFKNYLKFTPEKGTAFNFFSRIAKMCLFNYTTRRQKHRGHSDISEEKFIISRSENNFDLFLDNLEENLFKIINDNFENETLIKYEKIASIILEYLKENKNFAGKSDLYSFARGFGMRNSDIRKFILDVGKFKESIFKEV